MTSSKDIPEQEAVEVMIKNVMAATGLPRQAVREMLLADDELDGLCDAALSDLIARPDKVPLSKR